MRKDDLKKIMTDITKNYDDKEFDLASHLINYYYTNMYTGKELDKVSQLYFAYVWWELTIWLGQNNFYLKQDQKHLTKVDKFFEKEILKAKIVTYEQRSRLFHQWLGGEKNLNINKDQLENEIVETLINAFPNILSWKEVKRLLGLDKSVEELEKKLKEI